MPRRYFTGGLAALVTIAITAIIVKMMLLPEPEIAWNSGARERLAEALKAIASNLHAPDDGAAGSRFDPQEFIAQNMEQQVEPVSHNGRELVEKHGVTLRWRGNGVYQDVLFYPLAISNKVALEPHTDVRPTPEIVMVPVEDKDIETLPILYGCANSNANAQRECQLRRLKSLFLQQGIADAAVLMSDGTVLHIPVDNLFRDLPSTEPSKDTTPDA